MKKIFYIALCITLILSLCSCNKREYKEDIVVYPDASASATLGGYKNNNTSSHNNVGHTYYIVNTSSKKFHLSNCRYATKIKAENRKNSTDRQLLIDEGYTPCGNCKP